MYFITTVNKDDTRCVGYVSSYEEAVSIVENNCCDLYEAGCYPYAIIENIKEGLYQYDFNPTWFKYNEKTDKYDKIETEPDFVTNGTLGIGSTVGFAIG